MNKIIIICLIIGVFAFAESALPCAEQGKMCGGIAGIQCCEGKSLHCEIKDKNVADAAGTCLRNGCRGLNQSCGGFAGLACCDSDSDGQPLRCKITSKVADAMGKCVRA